MRSYYILSNGLAVNSKILKKYGLTISNLIFRKLPFIRIFILCLPTSRTARIDFRELLQSLVRFD